MKVKTKQASAENPGTRTVRKIGEYTELCK